MSQEEQSNPVLGSVYSRHAFNLCFMPLQLLLIGQLCAASLPLKQRQVRVNMMCPRLKKSSRRLPPPTHTLSAPKSPSVSPLRVASLSRHSTGRQIFPSEKMRRRETFALEGFRVRRGCAGCQILQSKWIKFLSWRLDNC